MNQQEKKEAISRFCNLLDRGAKKIGLKIPKNQYPEIEVGTEPVYDPLSNKLILPEEYIDSARIVGEYVGHVLRELMNRKKIRKSQRVAFKTTLLNSLGFRPKIQPSTQREKRDIEVDEFFGYLGRLLLEDITKPEDNLDFKSRTPYKMLPQHQESYRHAKSLSPEERNYKNLFQMSDKKVRKKFFRKSNVETMVKLAFLSAITLTFVLITENITGYAINQNPSNNNWLLIIIIIFLLILFYKNLKSNSKK